MGVPILESGDRFRRDPVMLELLGLESAADEATLRAWLEGQDWQGLRVLRAMNSNLVRQVMSEWGAAINPTSAKAFRLVHTKLLSLADLKAQAERKSKAGDNAQSNGAKSVEFLPVVLADTVFPVRTPEASEGQPAQAQRCWQTLSIGQFLLEAGWEEDPREDISHWTALKSLLTDHRDLWRGKEACFHYHNAPKDLVNDTPKNQDYRGIVGQAGFSMWTAPSDYRIEQLPTPYSVCPGSGERGWELADSNDPFADAYAIFRLPEDRGTLVAARGKSKADQLPRPQCLFMPTTQRDQRPASVLQLHASLEERPRVVDEMLDELAQRSVLLDKPTGNAAYFALATLAFNLIVTLRDSVLPPELRNWRLEKIIHEVLLAPARLSKRGRQRYASIWFPEGWLQPCQELMAAQFRPPKRGRPPGWRKAVVAKTSGGRRPKRAPKLDPLPDARPDSAPQAGGVAEDAARREPESF